MNSIRPYLLPRSTGLANCINRGSSLSTDVKAINDYDFVVSGVPDGSFFKFYGELFRTLSKNVDLIDPSGKKTKFKSIVLREGKLIYVKKAA